MRFTTALVLLVSAGFAAAQSTVASAATPSSSASSTCQAQNIVDACIASIQPQINACAGNDWICLCQQYQNLLTCYNNCPGLPEKATVQNQVTSFCTAAAPLLSSSAAAAATMPHASTSAAATVSAASAGTTLATATSAGATTKASGTASAASASSTGAAGFIAAPIGGVIALFLGVAGLF
ncbi:hypothetical protein K432DRAFT_385777 [Lepidopterella palustris CBS 459.81]|uniref:GPI anchored serine-threonine rich protein n=1 Tax=Lepidopterella palustris CBS 459.81 TaxID=1314670 RepID=A0A8E2E2F8_9PEZI|nr:hypothetical protein K432DRAFT_385777 [Lepidopterella palustris CBS 459.81]